LKKIIPNSLGCYDNSMKPAVLICAKRGKKAAREAAIELAKWLKRRGHESIDVTESDNKLTKASLKAVGLGVIIGGDGTFLTLVRRLERKDQFPLMGVNLGTLGFITEFGQEEMLGSVRDVLDQKYNEELRRMLQVELWRAGKCVESGIVFNDAALTKDARTSMLKLDVEVGDEHLSYVRADGYLVSTPTGSTAYSLSAGGPLLHPEVSGTVLVPICSHSLSTRPIIIPTQSKVQITLREFSGGAAYLVFDGQINFEVQPADLIRIQSAKSSLRLIRSPKQKWSETIRSKLQMS